MAKLALLHEVRRCDNNTAVRMIVSRKADTIIVEEGGRHRYAPGVRFGKGGGQVIIVGESTR